MRRLHEESFTLLQHSVAFFALHRLGFVAGAVGEFLSLVAKTNGEGVLQQRRSLAGLVEACLDGDQV